MVRRRYRHGLTLVELLVVVGIAAVLIAVLLPALSAARHQSRTLVCLANLRQLQTAFKAYTTQNREQSFEYAYSDAGMWMRLLQPYCGCIEVIGVCPEASEPSFGWGTATQSWGPGASLFGHQGSYCFNGWLYRIDRVDPGVLWGTRFPHANYLPLTAAQQFRIPTFVDGVWVDAWPSDTERPPATLQGSWDEVQNNEMGRVCIDRHRKSVNAAFLDGHAETLPLPTLWELQWSANFNANSAISLNK